jgi:L-iditol 2-dehydrogenase
MSNNMMPAARLHGPCDVRIDGVPHPGPPPPGNVLLRVEVVGICGSDLHTYRHARIGDTQLAGPLIMGHEFAGVVEAVGADCLDGHGRPLQPSARVAVDPAQPCERCEWCRRGDANLCPNMAFCGLWPHQGAMRPFLHVPASTCFPVPESMDATTAMLLEPLGVAIHALDLAKLRTGETVAVVGTGPIGLCVVRLAAQAGAATIFAADRLVWRARLAERFGASVAYCTESHDLVSEVRQATLGRGVDVAFEAASGGAALQQAAEMLAPGGRLMAIGIDEDDRFELRHSTARRKGLTIRMVRRMKHTYGRAIRLVEQQGIELAGLVSHRFPLPQAAEAFAVNAHYRDGVVKVVVDV